MKKAFGWIVVSLAVLALLVPVFAQGNRGKAELKAGSGSIVVDYGRPSLKGRDMLSQLQPDQFWRMGMNQAATLTTPVDLTFGSYQLPKGSYSLWLTKNAGDQFELVFNSQTGQWGTNHDKSKDIGKTAMKKDNVASPVETFTLELKQAGAGGSLELTWGSTKLNADFQIGK
jgi:hypothetical protein